MRVPEKDSYKLSMIHLLGLFALTISLTQYTPENGINCVYNSCIPIPQLIPFPFQWALIASSIVIVTNHALVRMFRPEED